MSTQNELFIWLLQEVNSRDSDLSFDCKWLAENTITHEPQRDILLKLSSLYKQTQTLWTEMQEYELYGCTTGCQQENEGLPTVGVTTICSGESITDCNGSGKAG
jgi:hypothetical protein